MTGIMVCFLLITAITIVINTSSVTAAISGNLPVSEMKYDANDNSAAFPESYRLAIRSLKEKHPNWVFKAVYTNLDWNTSIHHESYEVNRGISTVPSSYPDSWKKDGKNDFADGNFVVASKEAVAYCLDPRNYLTDAGVFQFETLTYSDVNSNIGTVEKLLAPTMMGTEQYKNKYKNNGNWITMDKTYAQMITQIGRETQVSPIHIASRMRQETGGNLANNLSINGSYPGYEGLYNFFNIRATPNADGTGSVANGLAYARSMGWTDPYQSIKGGISVIKDRYITWGQDTVYFQKFDVNNPYGTAKSLYSTQYMTNILAPTNEAKNSYNAYVSAGMINDAFEFHIPVYQNMPSTNVAYPGQASCINVEGPTNNQTFSGDIKIYGWAMSSDKNAKIKVSIDGKEISETVKRGSREDVLSSVSGYGGRENNPNPGFEVTVSGKNLTDDKHIILIEVISSGQVVASDYREIMVQKNQSRMYLEHPTDKQVVDKNVTVEGWLMTDAKNASLKVKVNGEEVSTTINRIHRDDVLSSVTGCGGKENNPQPGFRAVLDTINFPYGTNTVEVSAYAENGDLLKTVSSQFVIKKYETCLNVEVPDVTSAAKQEIYLRGWMMSEDKNATVKVELDGKDISDQIKRGSREDVLASVSGYGGRENNPNPGFEATISTNQLKDGQYELVISSMDSNGRTLQRIVRKVQVNKYRAKGYIEKPDSEVALQKTLFIRGWVMSENKDAILSISVDGNTVTNGIKRVTRNDVIDSVSGYGGSESNPTPGYELELDTQNLSLGNHILKVEVITPITNEVIMSETRNFSLRAPKTTSYLELPNQNASYGGDISVRGWVMSEDSDVDVKVYFDDVLCLEPIQRKSRNDVLASVSGYGDVSTNPNPGYEMTINTENIDYGNHTIRIDVTLANGSVVTTDLRHIVLKAPSAKIYIEKPNDEKQKTQIEIVGWMMSEDKNSMIQIYIDNQLRSERIHRVSRNDVLNAVKDCGGKEENPNPGFNTVIDTSKLKDGTHEIRVEVLSEKKKVIASQTKTIQIQKYEATSYIEFPQDAMIKQSQLNVKGWTLSQDKNATLRIYIDDSLRKETIKRGSRNDVLNAVNGYGDATINPNPGFEMTLDAKKLSYGVHKVRLEVISSNNEVIRFEEKTFTVRKPNSRMYIDIFQSQPEKDRLQIDGWAMTEDPEAFIVIFLDGSVIPETIHRVPREDVLQGISGYGGKETNPTPGFSTMIDTSGLTAGEHHVKIEVYSDVGDILQTESKSFVK